MVEERQLMSGAGEGDLLLRLVDDRVDDSDKHITPHGALHLCVDRAEHFRGGVFLSRYVA